MSSYVSSKSRVPTEISTEDGSRSWHDPDGDSNSYAESRRSHQQQSRRSLQGSRSGRSVGSRRSQARYPSRGVPPAYDYSYEQEQYSYEQEQEQDAVYYQDGGYYQEDGAGYYQEDGAEYYQDENPEIVYYQGETPPNGECYDEEDPQNEESNPQSHRNWKFAVPTASPTRTFRMGRWICCTVSTILLVLTLVIVMFVVDPMGKGRLSQEETSRTIDSNLNVQSQPNVTSAAPSLYASLAPTTIQPSVTPTVSPTLGPSSSISPSQAPSISLAPTTKSGNGFFDAFLGAQSQLQTNTVAPSITASPSTSFQPSAKTTNAPTIPPTIAPTAPTIAPSASPTKPKGSDSFEIVYGNRPNPPAPTISPKPTTPPTASPTKTRGSDSFSGAFGRSSSSNASSSSSSSSQYSTRPQPPPSPSPATTGNAFLHPCLFGC